MQSPVAPQAAERAEITAVGAALAGEARVIAVTGPVGVGKSFVARAAAAASLRDRVFEEVVAIDLAGAATLEAVLGRAGRALALAPPERLEAAAETRRVARAIEQRGQALVVLDGVDDALDDTRRLVAEWLDLALEARFLVTGRARLGIRDEQVMEVAPLAAPRGDALDGPAAAFFLARIRHAQPTFAPLPADAPLLAEIVRELDGLPLALELAAPRLAVMGPAALLHRLRSSHSVLRARAPAVGDRHRSFDAALEGSWLALHPWERTALAALTAFASFDLEDAEAVIDLRDQPAAPRVLDIVEGLRDKSLVATLERREAGELRMRLLASVADFVRRRADSAALHAANARHAQRYGDLARRAATAPRSAAGPVGRGVGADGENLLAVIRRALSAPSLGPQDAERALWALLALAPGLEPLPALAANARILDKVLEATQGSGADPRLLARAFALRGAMRRRERDLPGALRDLGRALHLARACADAALEGAVSIETAEVVEASGDPAAARSQAQAAARLVAGAGADETRALLALARTERACGQTAAAKAIVLRALALAEARGLAHDERRARLALAALLVDLGTLDEARAQAARVRSAGDAGEGVSCDRIEGACLHEEGDLQRARERYAASALAARRLGLAADEALALVLAGVAAIERRSFAEAYAQLTLATEVAEGPLRGLAEGLLSAAARLDADAGATVRSSAAPPIAPLERALVELATASSSPGAFAAARAKLVPALATCSLARIVVRAFDRCLATPGLAVAPPRDALVVGPGGRWFRARGGEAVSLERRRPLAMLLDCLVAARQESPGSAVPWSDLVEAAWPGERIIAQAGVHRVRVALSTLRKLGLRELLVTTPEGYALDRACPIFRAEEPPAP